MKVKEKDTSSDAQEKTPEEEEERNSTPRLREKTSSGSFRRTISPSGRMKKPASGLSANGEEIGEAHSRPVSRSRGRGRVREQDQITEASQISSDPETVSSENRASGETEEKEEGSVSRGRVRKPPSLASVVRHR